MAQRSRKSSNRPSSFASAVPRAAITTPRTRSRKTRSRSTSRTSTPSLAKAIANEDPASPPTMITHAAAL